ncbi:MAG: hypothetical protein GY804_09950 [Alphaproteobacteria bacterium]|nr:hypothetical protein [Alphaproteobacteria bacterium]
MTIKEFFNPGIMKAHSDIVGYYLARIQSVVVMVTAFKLLGMDWFWAILLFLVLVLITFIGAIYHYKYIYPDETNYVRKLDPFMVDMDKKLNEILEKYEKK